MRAYELSVLSIRLREGSWQAGTAVRAITVVLMSKNSCHWVPVHAP